LLANTGGGCRRIHNERSDFAADILRQSFREMTKEMSKNNCVDWLKTDDLATFYTFVILLVSDGGGIRRLHSEEITICDNM
jgi:hypothetical protein